MALKAVPKPAGFELNQARSDKSASARDWLPEDALYSAWEQIQKDRPVHGALVVAWYSLSEAGLPILKFTLHNEECRLGLALAADLQFEMQLASRSLT